MRTGKLSREDYEAVDGALRAEALEVLNRLQALEREESNAGASQAVDGRPSETTVGRESDPGGKS